MRALRFALDIVRGYMRAADGMERAYEMLRGNELDERYIGAFGEVVKVIGAARREPGGLGIGARIAVTEHELTKMEQAHELLEGRPTS